jgi:hypothetical protein
MYTLDFLSRSTRKAKKKLPTFIHSPKKWKSSSASNTKFFVHFNLSQWINMKTVLLSTFSHKKVLLLPLWNIENFPLSIFFTFPSCKRLLAELKGCSKFFALLLSGKWLGWSERSFWNWAFIENFCFQQSQQVAMGRRENALAITRIFS